MVKRAWLRRLEANRSSTEHISLRDDGVYFSVTPPLAPLALLVGGAGICHGPSNFMANAYMGIPISITVEGANTLTRSLIIFGQGLTRSHPHLLDIIRAIQDGDDMKVCERKYFIGTCCCC